MPAGQSLNRVIDTVPGIVRFSYDEPVAHGFHGVSYEVDGAPVPLTTSSNFAELIDPRNIDSLERSPERFRLSSAARVTACRGEYRDQARRRHSQWLIDRAHRRRRHVRYGDGGPGASLNWPDRRVLQCEHTALDRGLDSPTQTQVHDDSSLSDVFLRTITRFNPNDTPRVHSTSTTPIRFRSTRRKRRSTRSSIRRVRTIRNSSTRASAASTTRTPSPAVRTRKSSRGFARAMRRVSGRPCK